MNESINLTRARVIEFDVPSTKRAFLMKREHPSDSTFLGMYVDASRECDVDGVSLDYIKRHGQNIRILAEFPVALADLIPGDCQAFRFNHNGVTDTAVFDMVFKAWKITGHDVWHATLESLAAHFEIDLNTVAPLELRVHPDYVEGRR